MKEKNIHPLLYGETVKRFNEIKSILRKQRKKLNWKQIFDGISAEYPALKKEANDKGVYIEVIVNREVMSILDKIEGVDVSEDELLEILNENGMNEKEITDVLKSVYHKQSRKSNNNSHPAN